jgi:hypothetical protein
LGRRLILVLTFAVSAAALVFPGGVAAADADGFEHEVKYNYCDGLDPNFKVVNRAAGWTNANKLTNESWVERRTADGAWKVHERYPTRKFKFEINGDLHWLTSWRRWDGDREFWYRIGFRLRAWHNSNLLSSTVVYSVKC